jgi:AraC-like DNA-binding protein
LGTLLGAKSGTRVVAFHLVEFGHCEIKLENGDHAVIAVGEMAVCFAGVAHRISQGRNPNVLPVERILAGSANVSLSGTAGRTRGASLLCGVFQLHDTFLNPLFAALPPLLRTSVSRTGEFHNLSGVARLMAQEIDNKNLGSNYIVERLLEVLCAEAIRAHIETAPQLGWFCAIKDPVIGHAIAAIHARPSEDWSVQRLAQGVSLSPSRFAARFAATLGESPMAYVAKWRMSVACQLLAGTQQAIDRIAADVGYDNPAAFNRAFKKHVGVPPATWRARERA